MIHKQLVVIAKMRARVGCEQKAKEELLKLVAPTVKEDGCFKYELHFSLQDPALFMFYEIWRDQAALSAHSESSHIQEFRSRRDKFIDGPTELTLWEQLP